MTITIGEAEYRYEVTENWGDLPDGWRYGEVAAVGVDSKDNVYVFNRGKHPMIVFDRTGKFLRSWAKASLRARTASTSRPTIHCGARTMATTPFAT